MQTLGGRQFWGDVQFFRGWRIQRNVFTGHYRLLDQHDFRHAWGSWGDCRRSLDAIRQEQKSEPASRRGVILVHGILRSSKSCATLAGHLRGCGWEAFPFDYPSTQESIRDAAEYLHSVIERLDEIDELHFVGHSLGGLVIRAWFAAHDDPRVQRTVMLGTPNHGAELADMLRKNLLFRAVFGPAGQQLVTDAGGLIPQLPAPRGEFAVIAGARGTPDGWNPLISGDDDGTVSVESTQLTGMSDFATVRTLHTNLLASTEVAVMVERFLSTGRLASPEAQG
jgi:pimeloyl-ACP methyl ester carboxylesterase